MLSRISAATLLLCGLSVFAQTPSGSVVGRVTDSAGGVVPNARVKLTNLDTNQGHEVATRDTGDFTVPNLAPGRYALESRHDRGPALCRAWERSQLPGAGSFPISTSESAHPAWRRT